MLCTSNCLSCNNEQFYKVNFTLYHGLCEKHVETYDKKIVCNHCQSVVPVLFIKPIRCFNCRKTSQKSFFDCQHWICEDCIKVINVCPLCLPKKVENSCEYCCLLKNPSLLECNHLICSNCKTNDECLLCKQQKDQEHQICDYCHNEGKIVNVECGHIICEKCFDSEHLCSLCQFLNTELCAQCENLGKIIETHCDHKVCDKCFQAESKCPLCIIKNCDFCGKVDKTLDFLCGHAGCEDCQLKNNDICTLCSRIKCRFCYNSNPKAQTACDHDICKNCFESMKECPICIKKEQSSPKLPQIKEYSQNTSFSTNNKLIVEEASDENKELIDGNNASIEITDFNVDGDFKQVDENFDEKLGCKDYFLIFFYVISLGYCFSCCFSCFCLCFTTKFDEYIKDEESTFSKLFCYCCCEYSSKTKRLWKSLISCN